MPYEVIKLDRLKSVLERLQAKIYEPVADLEVSARVTKEPVTYADRMSGRPLKLQNGDKWGEASFGIAPGSTLQKLCRSRQKAKRLRCSST